MSKFLKIFTPALGGAGSVLAMAYVLADQFVVDMPAPIREAVAVSPAHAQQAEETVTSPETMVQASAPSSEGGFGIGREALPEEIAAWDIDIRPDGLGLPAGSGDVWTGEEVFVEKCAVCHGDFGEGAGRWPVLAGGQGTLSDEDPVKTIGSYWPYLSTVYDYVNRAMPFGEAQSLEPDEVYAITAYLLYLNDQVEDDFTLSNENFLDVEMPNTANFYPDDRADAELPIFTTVPCMENCKDSVEITMRASVLDVTPQTEDEEATVEEAAATMQEAAEPVQEAVATADETPAATSDPDPALVAAGEGAFRQCKACHQVGEDAVNRTGPHLNGIIGRTVGGMEDFRYSRVFGDAAAAGDVWTKENLAAFLADPRGTMAGTKMSFRGVREEADIAALIAYLQSFDE